MMRTALASLLVLAGAAGCSTEPVEAPYYSDLLVPEEIGISWFGCEIEVETGLPTNPFCENSDPVVVRLTVRVIEEESEIPMNNIRVYFNSGFSSIYLLPTEVLRAVEVPSDGDDGEDEWGRVSEEVWAEFAAQYAGDYRPTYHEGFTDSSGNAEVWLWVDEMPRDSTGKAVEAEIGVSTAADFQVISLTPAE